MQASVSNIRVWCIALVVLAAGTTGAWADTWLGLSPEGDLLLSAGGAADPVQIAVEHADEHGLAVSVHLDGIPLNARKTVAGEFVELTWPDAAVTGRIGAPEVPVYRGLFVAPMGTEVVVTAVPTAEAVADLATLGFPGRVMPHQAPVEKLPGALERAPFDYDESAYGVAAELLAPGAAVFEAGIFRGQRVMLLEVYPVSYNPAAQTLTLRQNLTVNITFEGAPATATELDPLPGLRKVVLNPELVPTATQRGSGNYLIITANSWASTIAAFAAAKEAQGFDVTVHSVADGTSNTTIKSYIQSLWGGANSPDYVLLVGDTNTIPHWTGGGEGSPSTDIQYACMDGSSDWAPDIASGRFSCRTTAQLQAIIDKTLYYENGPLADPDYVKRAVFMASNDNYTVSEGTHNYVVNTHMIPNEIECDLLYCHTYGATTQQVRNAFNDGRFFGIYSGHGGTTSWADGPPFSQSDVNGLTNVNMYPYVLSFACVTGTYTVDECFTETWSRAANKGAVTIYGSSVNSYWTEDDILERVVFDSIYDLEDDVVGEVGPVWVDGLVRFIAHFGSDSTTRRYFEMYNLLGDPALQFPGNCSDAGIITLDAAKYNCDDTALITVGDCGLNLDDQVADTVDVLVASDSEPAGETVTLVETDVSSATFEGTLAVNEAGGPGILYIAEGDTITATYIDADDGQGGVNVEVTDTAIVDCAPPDIMNVQAINVEARSAEVIFNSDEPVRGTVHYGDSCGQLSSSASSAGYVPLPSIGLSGLNDNHTYFYAVTAEDEAGNESYDDNDGACYSFTTPEVPDFFTEIFESSDNDLDNKTLVFTPDGGNDFYKGCTILEVTELPTDPTGGSSLSFSPSNDDGAAQVTLTGGETISLYGQSYGSFYVGTNGYLTFDHSETGYTESLEAHFGTPRVCGLFDDLDPGQGGTVTYKQLADRVAVTYDAVVKHSTSTANTFQIELFFDGTIVITYLTVGITDGLAGLSDGGGLDPDYFESDLSAMQDCGPSAPKAFGAHVVTDWANAITVALQATDDGLPNPPGVLKYTIAALPTDGTLTDPTYGDLIDLVPYTLAEGGNEVVYSADPGYVGPDSFQFVANDSGVPEEGGGDSNVATISIDVLQPEAILIHATPLDVDPGWSMEGGWAFGQPTGSGTHGRDPSNGYTGTNVLGYNLAGDYSDNMTEVEYLTSTAFDCSGLTGTQLRFRRWLGVEQAEYDHANLEVSSDGVEWNTVWEHTGTSFSETEWVYKTYDLSSLADGQDTVYVRWGMGPTDDGVTYPGWNLDDVEIWAAYAPQNLHIVASYPPDGAIDACQPIDPDTLEAQGLESVEITFDGAADAMSATKFTLEEVCEAGDCDGVAPQIDSVDADGSVVTLNLDRPLDPMAWTVITYVDGDANDVVRLGFLPADADNSGTANANDIVAVVDAVTGGGPLYQYDIDRSGAITANDIVVLIDLLNGAGAFEPYFDEVLPEMP